MGELRSFWHTLIDVHSGVCWIYGTIHQGLFPTNKNVKCQQCKIRNVWQLRILSWVCLFNRFYWFNLGNKAVKTLILPWKILHGLSKGTGKLLRESPLQEWSYWHSKSSNLCPSSILIVGLIFGILHRKDERRRRKRIGMTRSVRLVWSRWVPRVKIPLLWTMLLRKALEPEWVDGQMKLLPVQPSEIQLHPFPHHYAHQLILMTFSNYRTKHSTNIIEQWVILLKKNFNTNHHNFSFSFRERFLANKGPKSPTIDDIPTIPDLDDFQDEQINELAPRHS